MKGFSWMLFATVAPSCDRMHHMSQTQIESSNQPLNLSHPSKLKAKLSARHLHAMTASASARSRSRSPSSPPSSVSSSTSPSSVTKPKARLGSHHHHHHHHHDDKERSCNCPQLDSKNTILYRLLTEGYSYWTPVCCIGGKCHDGHILGQSKLKILLEESKRQAVQ